MGPKRREGTVFCAMECFGFGFEMLAGRPQLGNLIWEDNLHGTLLHDEASNSLSPRLIATAKVPSGGASDEVDTPWVLGLSA